MFAHLCDYETVIKTQQTKKVNTMATFNMTHTINEDGTMTEVDKTNMIWFDAEQVFDYEDKMEIHEVDLEDYDEWVEKNM